MNKNSKNNSKSKIFKKCLNKWGCSIKVTKNNRRNSWLIGNQFLKLTKVNLTMKSNLEDTLEIRVL